MHLTRSWALTLAAGLLGLATTSCAGTSATDAIHLTPPTTGTGTSSTTPPTSNSAVARAVTQAIARADADSDGVTLHLEIHSLRREPGDLVTLKLTVAANGAESRSFGGIGTADPYLVDPAKRKRYELAKDGKGSCVCSDRWDPGISAGETREFFYTFNAPPATLKAVTVVLPGFSPLEDVPLSS